MAIDADEIAGQIWQAMRGQLEDAADAELASAKARAQALAEAVSEISQQVAVGGLTKAEAQQMLTINAQAMEAGLQADLGLGELQARSLVKTGLKVVAGIALNAAGVGWLAPVVDGVIGQI